MADGVIKVWKVEFATGSRGCLEDKLNILQRHGFTIFTVTGPIESDSFGFSHKVLAWTIVACKDEESQ